MAEQVGPSGRVLSLDVDTRFQPSSAGVIEVRTIDVTDTPIGEGEFDCVHARALLQHLAQREAVLDAMIAAAKPGGWIVVSDVDWIQFDAQAVPEPFATLSRVLRDLSSSRHGYDGAWGRRLVEAFTARGLTDVDARGEVWTMRGGTDSAEWYVAALERALDVLPPEVFPDGFDPRQAIAQAREPGFAILSPISVTAWGRRRIET
jgi:SAM-dependent methyltransferase